MERNIRTETELDNNGIVTLLLIGKTGPPVQKPPKWETAGCTVGADKGCLKADFSLSGTAPHFPLTNSLSILSLNKHVPTCHPLTLLVVVRQKSRGHPQAGS